MLRMMFSRAWWLVALLWCCSEGERRAADDVAPPFDVQDTSPADEQASPDGRGDDADDVADADAEPPGTRALTHWGDPQAYFDRPFPCATRFDAEGRLDVSAYPNPRNNRFVRALLEILADDVRGAPLSAGIFFPLSGPVASASLPQGPRTPAVTDPVLLALLDAAPHERLLWPVTLAFEDDGGPFGAPNLLSLLPYPGVPLLPDRAYAAIVTTRVLDAAGAPLRASAEVAALLADEDVAGLAPHHAATLRRVADALPRLNLAPEEVAAFTVIQTGHPLRQMAAAVASLQEQATLEPSAWILEEVHPTFCVLRTEVDMPVYQAGTPPFQQRGGAWVWEGERLVLQSVERARVLVTLPTGGATPPAGWPAVVFVRTGGGGDRPLVDRGVRGAPGGPALEPGTGYAEDLAAAGIVGISVDGPHGGLRNVTQGDEQFLMFNITNPPAMRDNIRQSALELVHLADALPGWSIPRGLCAHPETQEVSSIDPHRVGLFGHSMGATIAPLALAYAPLYRAAVLSGAGGSWIANVVHKEQPLPVRPLAELTLSYGSRRLHEHDIALSLLQWAGEAADPPLYGAAIAGGEGASRDPVHMLMIQGIADTYILPPIANALTLALRLDLGGEALDTTHPVAGRFTGIAGLLAWTGGRQRALPIVGEPGRRTAVVVQHWEDGIEDGHEVAFQLPEPKHQARCFFTTAFAGLGGAPSVVAPEGRWSPCDAGP